MANIAITGAGRGIALDLTRQHLARGDRVFALVRNPGTARDLGALSNEYKKSLSIQQMDVGSDASVDAAVAAIGDEPIDLLYNVAGVVGEMSAQLESVDWEDFDAAIEVMLKGPLRVLVAFLPNMKEGSKVINFSSQLAASTWPYGGFYPYVAAKAGLNRLMRSVAIDLKDRGIVVGIIHPGYVQTDMGGPDADITPEESARGIIALADKWGIEETGEFYKWNGEKHAW